MQDMLILLLYTLFFLLAGACISKVFHFAIQPNQAIDMLLGWQKMLNALYESNNKLKNLLGKALGDCEMCMSFWFSAIWSIMFLVFMMQNDVWAIKGFIGSVIYLLAFHGFSTVLSLYFIVNLFNKKK